MKKSRICVVESDFITSSGIKERLINSGCLSLTGINIFDDVKKIIETLQPDLILMDVFLKEENDGLLLAKEITEKFNIPIIFLTSNSDLNVFSVAKQISPKAYLINPISDENLIASVEIAIAEVKASRTINKNSNYIFIKDGTNLNKIFPDTILYLKSEHVYVKVVTINESYLVRTSISEFISEHQLDNLIKVQRSFAVNKYYINSISSNRIIIQGVEIPLSRKHRAAILKDISS